MKYVYIHSLTKSQLVAKIKITPLKSMKKYNGITKKKLMSFLKDELVNIYSTQLKSETSMKSSSVMHFKT